MITVTCCPCQDFRKFVNLTQLSLQFLMSLFIAYKRPIILTVLSCTMIITNYNTIITMFLTILSTGTISQFTKHENYKISWANKKIKL